MHHLKQRGLLPLYNKDEHFNEYVRKLKVLALIPPTAIHAAIDYITDYTSVLVDIGMTLAQASPKRI